MSEVAKIEPVEPTPQVEDEVIEPIEGQEAEAPELLEGSDETPNEDDAQAETPKPAGRRDKRISQLTFEKYEVERTKNAEIEALKQQLTQQQVQPTATTEKPTLAQFDYDTDLHNEAVMDWKVDQKLSKYIATQDAKAQATQDSQAVTDWNQRSQGYAAENPGYLEVATQRGQAVTSQAVASYLSSSEIGPKLHHNLLDNFEDLQRIQSLPEWQQGAELAKLETKLSKVKPIQKSKAPTPVKPVGSNSSTPAKTGGAMPSNW